MDPSPRPGRWRERLLHLAAELVGAALLGGLGVAVVHGLEKLGVPTDRADVWLNAAVATLGALALAFVFRQRAKRRNAARGMPVERSSAEVAGLPLEAAPDAATARSVRSGALFGLALLSCFGPLATAGAVLELSAWLGLAVAAFAVGVAAWLVRFVAMPVPHLRFTGTRIVVGSSELVLNGPYSCSFPDRGGVASWLAEASFAPAVEVGAGGGRVRFRPGRYERVTIARLVHALAHGAAGGDARAWLVTTWPLPPAGAEPGNAGPWLHPLVAFGVALVFLIGLGTSVLAASLIVG